MQSYRYVFVVLLSALPYRAVSQQQTGTIVVSRLLPDHAIVAADSKAIRLCPGAKKPIVRYDVCKVWAFDNRFGFAASGNTANFTPCESTHKVWDVFQIAQDIFGKGNISTVDDFAHKWAAEVVSIANDPRSQPVYAPGNNVFAGALFIGFSGGTIVAEVVLIQRPRDASGFHAQFLPEPPDGKLSDMGEDDIITEFLANKTSRAKLWHKSIDKLGNDDQIVALAKLVKDFDRSGKVGGDIDTLVIGPFGMNWLSRKYACRQK